MMAHISSFGFYLLATLLFMSGVNHSLALKDIAVENIPSAVDTKEPSEEDRLELAIQYLMRAVVDGFARTAREVREIKDEVKLLDEEITSLREGKVSLREDTTSLKEDMTSLNGGMKSLEDEMSHEVDRITTSLTDIMTKANVCWTHSDFASLINIRHRVQDYQWETYKIKLDKNYSTIAEELKRRLIYEDNMAYINKHNLEAAQGKHSFTLGEGPFTDMTNEEYRKATRCLLPSETPKPSDTTPRRSRRAVPDSIDWRNYGVVATPQLQKCNDCWAFSSVAVTESRYAIKTKNAYKLSEQQLVDCDADNNGCDPSYIDRAYKYIVQNGLESEDSYPYADGVQHPCTFDPSRVVVRVQNYNAVGPDPEAMRVEIGTNGPITFGIMSASRAFQLYARGILDDFTCGPAPDHAITAIGYGTDGGRDYWILKNSWGTDWGEEGFMRVARGKNMCGVEQGASFFDIV